MKRRWRAFGLVLGLAISGFILAAAGAPADAPPPSRDGDDGFLSLSDGRSLAGWKVVAGLPDAWKVEGGSIVGSGKGGGWLGPRRDFADFVPRLEFRLSPEGHSSLYLRAPTD